MARKWGRQQRSGGRPQRQNQNRRNRNERRRRRDENEREEREQDGGSFDGWEGMESIETPYTYDSPDDILLKPWEYIEKAASIANEIANEILGESTTIYRQGEDFDYSEWNLLTNPGDNWGRIGQSIKPDIEIRKNGCETCVVITFGIMGVPLNPIIYCRRSDSPECSQLPDVEEPETEEPYVPPNSWQRGYPAGIYESQFLAWMSACEQDGFWYPELEFNQEAPLTQNPDGSWSYNGPLHGFARFAWGAGRTWGYDDSTLASVKKWAELRSKKLLTIEEYNSDDESVVTDPVGGWSDRFLFFPALQIPGWDGMSPDAKIEAKSRVRIIQGALTPVEYSTKREGLYHWKYGVNNQFVAEAAFYGNSAMPRDGRAEEEYGIKIKHYIDDNGIPRGYYSCFVAKKIKQYVRPPYEGYPFQNISIEILSCSEKWENLFSTKFVNEDRVPQPPSYHSSYRLCRYRLVQRKHIDDSRYWASLDDPYLSKHNGKIDTVHLSDDRSYILFSRGKTKTAELKIAGLNDEYEVLPAIAYSESNKGIYDIKMVGGLRCPNPPVPAFQEGVESVRNCCSQMQCSKIIRLLEEQEERLKKIEKVLAPDRFPAELPQLLIDPTTSDTKATFEVDDYANLLQAILRQIDRGFGPLPLTVSIDDTNDVKDGNQPYEVQVMSISDALKQVIQMSAESGGDVNTLLNIMARVLMETGLIHKISAETRAEMEGLVEFLGYEGEEVQEKIPFVVDPTVNGEDLDKLTEESTNEVLGKMLQNRMIDITYYECRDRNTLTTMLGGISRDTSAAIAATTSPIKSKTDLKLALDKFDYKALVGGALLIKRIREAFDSSSGNPDEFRKSLEELEKRYTEGSSPIWEDNRHDYQMPKDETTGQPIIEIEATEHLTSRVDRIRDRSESKQFWKGQGFGADGTKTTKKKKKKK